MNWHALLHRVTAKGEHLFHGSYLTVEMFVGHAPLTYLAGLTLACIVVHAAVEIMSHSA